MAKAAIKTIKAVLGLTRVTDVDFLARLNKVYEGLLNNAAYPTPPVDMPGFKAAIDAYSAAITAALDGGKSAITARDKRRNDVAIMYRLLGHYVEATAKEDMNTFVSSGFVAHVPAPRSAPQPVAVPTVSSVDQGSTGQLLVSIAKVAKARSYDIRYAPVPTGGTPAGTNINISWTIVSVATTKPATPINDLTPGTTYTFQARAFGKLGFSDWSDAVNRMCT